MSPFSYTLLCIARLFIVYLFVCIYVSNASPTMNKRVNKQYMPLYTDVLITLNNAKHNLSADSPIGGKLCKLGVHSTIAARSIG